MKYLAAYLLSAMGGNNTPNAKDIEKILGSVDLDVDMEEANKIVKALSGKSVDEIISAGNTKISSVPAASSVTGVGTLAATPASKAAALEIEKKKEEVREESDDDDMILDIFA